MREKITSFIFIFLLAAFFMLVIVLPKDERASVKENRPLAEMPEVSISNIFKGSFTTDFETFLTDKVAFRSHFVDFGTKLEELKGISPEESEKVITLANGSSLVFSNGKIMEIYKENPAARDTYISALNDIFGKFDCKKYLMLVPTQIEFDKTEYRHYSDSQKQSIDSIYSSLKNVTGVNVYDRLSASTDEYIYFRTDHHWTQRGAYLGYESFMEAEGESPVPLSSLKANKVSGFLGYLYNQSNEAAYAKFADDIEYFTGDENYTVYAKSPDANGKIVDYSTNIYFIPADGSTPNYGIFMGGDHAFARVETGNKNGKTLLVIKDSYANALLPLLTNNYETILVIDPRNYFGTIEDLKTEYQIDEVAVINYVISTSLPGYIDMLDKIE